MLAVCWWGGGKLKSRGKRGLGHCIARGVFALGEGVFLGRGGVACAVG